MTGASVSTTGASLFGALYSLACYDRAASQLRRRVAPMRKVRSKEWSWVYPQYESHGGAFPGSGADRPRLPELKSRLGFKNLTS